ncbi:crosslink repair DNA glycosylase YcaQ family protein [Oerskovia sp. M15]
MTGPPSGSAGPPALDAARVVATRLGSHRLRGDGPSNLRDVVGHLGPSRRRSSTRPCGASRSGRRGRRPLRPRARRSPRGDPAHARPASHVAHGPARRRTLAPAAHRARVHRLNAPYYPDLGGPAQDAAASDLLAEAVAGGNHRTRAEFAALLADRGLPSTGIPFTYILMRAELDRVVISGGLRGKQQTYAAFDERVPVGYGPLGTSFDEDVALVELVRRYLRSRGLATIKDFAGWSGLTLRQARRGLEMLGAEVEQVVGAQDTGAGRGSSSGGSSTGRRSSLPSPLSMWTCSRVRRVRRVVQGQPRPRARPALRRRARGAALRPPGAEESPFLHVVAVDGRVVGRWRHVLTTRSLRLDTQLFRPLTPPEREAFEAQARRLATHWGVEYLAS